jgi:hypothetical protein
VGLDITIGVPELDSIADAEVSISMRAHSLHARACEETYLHALLHER